MQFESSHIYHIYNQGNNQQQIFFCRENYLFFLKKMREYLLPYVDILAWCLMPNHFHWMVYVREAEQLSSDDFESSDEYGLNSSDEGKYRLNQSIAVLLRSYTRAINKQQNRTGSLFRPKTKAECVTKSEGITPSYYNTSFGASINTHNVEADYPKICFDYIHNNPRSLSHSSDGLKSSDEHWLNWEFSSANDYYGGRNGRLVNKEVTQRFGLTE